MIVIDGSQGEGGGQILRSSLALSMATGTPFRIDQIRAQRKKPGLLRQHLTAVQAATEICGAETLGASLGSARLDFKPGKVKPGEYTFAIGSAGSATLVLQTVLPVLLTASGPSTLVVEGGTHNPFAPPFDFLVRAFLPLIERMGARVNARLERHGFFPAGGGKAVFEIEPASKLTRLEISERGETRRKQARALVANLPVSIGERELSVVREKLGWDDACLRAEKVPSNGPGNALLIEIESGCVTEVFSAFGERGRAAEDVARAAVDEARAFLSAEVAIGGHLADQLMLPMALGCGGRFLTSELSMHSKTNMDVIRLFLRNPMKVESIDRRKVMVEIEAG